jgi:hypothetical protein
VSTAIDGVLAGLPMLGQTSVHMPWRRLSWSWTGIRRTVNTILVGSRHHPGLFSQVRCKDPPASGVLVWRCVPASIVPYCEALELVNFVGLINYIYALLSNANMWAGCVCGYFVTSWLVEDVDMYYIQIGSLKYWSVPIWFYSKVWKLSDCRNMDERRRLGDIKRQMYL